MKEFRGTKGKWMYTPHMGDYDVRVDDRTKYHRMITICEVNYNPQRPDEAEANAQLIAAAPELLEALQAIYELLEEELPNWYLQKYHRLMINAINKVLGKDNLKP